MGLFSKFNKQNKQPEITRTQALRCIPIRSESVEWRFTENDVILLEYPLALKPFFLSLAKRFDKSKETRLTKKLQLDVTGSQVWHLLDGSRDVKTLIKITADETGLSLQEAELAVTTFLRELGRRGLIFLRQP